MRFAITCPNCEASYDVTEKHVGKTTTCKSCGQGMRIGSPRTKACPHCEEQVSALSEKCDYCGGSFDARVHGDGRLDRFAERRDGDLPPPKA